jgi:uncharacterized protein YbaR (Trm112 family)
MVDPDLLAILACPWCLGRLEPRETRLVCGKCGAAYAVQDDVPNLIVDEAELRCPLCRAVLSVAKGQAACGACGRAWSTRDRLPEDP